MILKTASLSPNILHIVHDKGTEQPFTGLYDTLDEPGSYVCRQCGLALFRSKTKFRASCGWPSFDQEILDTVKREPDPDGRRTEIVCERCDAHLGHVFQGEGYTTLNTRHCVNSASLDFVPDLTINDTEEAILAAGCFWGVETLFQQLPGVLKTEVGYTGGTLPSPTYEKICQGNTGHYEAMRVLYDPEKINFEKIIKYFFEIHDPTQKNGQGPDIGHQYRSAIFCYNDTQKQTAQAVITQLEQQENCTVTTALLPASIFWPAEEYHQNYYHKTGKQPYCHRYTKKF